MDIFGGILHTNTTEITGFSHPEHCNQAIFKPPGLVTVTIATAQTR